MYIAKSLSKARAYFGRQKDFAIKIDASDVALPLQLLLTLTSACAALVQVSNWSR